MRPYFHLFCKEEPYLSRRTPQKVLVLVLAQWYYNCYMGPELVNKYNWWQVGSVPVSFTEYQKSNICPDLMYMQHRNMVCGELHIFHDLVLDQNVNDNSYQPPCSTRLWVWTTKWYFWESVNITIHFHIFVCNISIILNMILSVRPFSFTGSLLVINLINDLMFTMLLRHIFWGF